MKDAPRIGIDANRTQFLQQLLQVFFVGMTLGMMRTVVPALAESEFGVAEGSFIMLTSFVVAFGFVKGVLNFVAGRLSDRLGRQPLIVWGMWVCGAGVGMTVMGEGVAWWVLSAAVTGLGMAMLYPTLSAAVADISAPQWRGSAIGTYRFWRDLGYGFGALGLGLAAHWGGAVAAGFWFVFLSMMVSGLVVWWLGEETHPALNPAGQAPTERR